MARKDPSAREHNAKLAAGLIIGGIAVVVAGAMVAEGNKSVGGVLVVVGVAMVGAGIIIGMGGNRGGGGRSCFVAGTVVLMADKTQKPIEQIRVNDLVLSRHETTGAMGARRVTKVFVHDVDATLNMTLDTGQTIGTTEAHRFALAAGGFCAARSIAVGTRLCTDESFAQVAGRQTVATPSRVYNLAVEEYHSYFVGPDHVCVHNLKENEGEEPADPDEGKGDEDP
jgi:hypothetical protein